MTKQPKEECSNSIDKRNRKIIKEISQWTLFINGMGEQPNFRLCYSLSEMLHAYYYLQKHPTIIDKLPFTLIDERTIAALYTAMSFAPNGKDKKLAEYHGVEIILREKKEGGRV